MVIINILSTLMTCNENPQQEISFLKKQHKKWSNIMISSYNLRHNFFYAFGGFPYHQGISWPSQAKNLPLSDPFALLMMPSNFWTENSLVKSLPSGTFLWNGLDKSVSTVPGCSRMHIIGSFLRANSTDTVLVTARFMKRILWSEHHFHHFKNLN